MDALGICIVVVLSRRWGIVYSWTLLIVKGPRIPVIGYVFSSWLEACDLSIAWIYSDQYRHSRRVIANTLDSSVYHDRVETIVNLANCRRLH